MKMEYTAPEIDITLFATTSIMSSDTSSGIDVEDTPGTIPADTWLD